MNDKSPFHYNQENQNQIMKLDQQNNKCKRRWGTQSIYNTNHTDNGQSIQEMTKTIEGCNHIHLWIT